MTESQKLRLIQLASEMVSEKDMPLEFHEDWKLPKTTPKKTKREIEAAAKIARAMCREWAKRIMAVVDGAKLPD